MYRVKIHVHVSPVEIIDQKWEGTILIRCLVTVSKLPLVYTCILHVCVGVQISDVRQILITTSGVPKIPWVTNVDGYRYSIYSIGTLTSHFCHIISTSRPQHHFQIFNDTCLMKSLKQARGCCYKVDMHGTIYRLRRWYGLA